MRIDMSWKEPIEVHLFRCYCSSCWKLIRNEDLFIQTSNPSEAIVCLSCFQLIHHLICARCHRLIIYHCKRIFSIFFLDQFDRYLFRRGSLSGGILVHSLRRIQPCFLPSEMFSMWAMFHQFNRKSLFPSKQIQPNLLFATFSEWFVDLREPGVEGEEFGRKSTEWKGGKDEKV